MFDMNGYVYKLWEPPRHLSVTS